jgi:lipoprotein-anchoring transpeptidase ErfK/SrfK
VQNRVRSFVCAAGLAAALATPSALPATPTQPASLPAAGYLARAVVTARVAPSKSARSVLVLHQFRRDFRPQIVLATGARNGPDGQRWLRLELPMRPNGKTGWVPAASVEVTAVTRRVIVHRGLRLIEVYRGARRLLRAPVAVGAPGMETPLGHFYVTARFVPNDPFLGVFALETSAYSKLSEWPGGGVVGIHGTSRPDLLGQAVSHGCIRVSNATAAALRRLAPLGTPIRVVAN